MRYPRDSPRRFWRACCDAPTIERQSESDRRRHEQMNRSRVALKVALPVCALAAAWACSTTSSINPTVDGSIQTETSDAGDDAPSGPIPSCIDAAVQLSVYPTSSLPEGGCSAEGAQCQLTANPCCSFAEVDLRNEYTCTCSGGQWQCALTSQGLAPCNFGTEPNCTDGGGQ